MRSSVIALATGSAIALTLTACGSDSGGGEALTGSGSGANCTISEPIPVGAVVSQTGAAASYGESQKEGLELAVKQLKKQNGDDVSYDLTVEDDATDPKQDITLFEQLIQDGSSIIIGPTLSNGAFQAQPIAQEEGVPVLAISNTADGIPEQGDYIFRDSLSERQVIPETVATATESYDLTSVVLMYSDDDAFTESGAKVFRSALQDEGVEIAETLTFSKTDTDFRALLTKAKKAEPDAVVVSGLIEAAIPLVTQARQLGIDAPIIGGNGFNNPKLMADAGKDAEGVVVGAAWNSSADIEANDAFLKAYEKEYGSQPDQFAAQAYAAMTIIDAAVRENCSGERDDIRDGLTKVSDLPTVLGDFSMKKSRDADHQPVVQVVEDGAFGVLDQG